MLSPSPLAGEGGRRPASNVVRLGLVLCVSLATATAFSADDNPPRNGSPLDRLRNRNAQEMWKQLNRQNTQPQQMPQPDNVRPGKAMRRQRSGPEMPNEGLPVPVPQQPSVPAREASHNPARSVAKPLTVAQLEPIPEISDPVRDPRELKKLGGIVPHFDYEPDPLLADRCQDLCPRPGHCLDCQRKRPEELGPGEVACQECPEEVVLSRELYAERAFPDIAYCWEASNTKYYPLYFEDFPLERYGHTRHFLIQPIVSVPKWIGQAFFMPYQLSLCPPWHTHYPLGYYRPGECVPYKYYQVPLDARAAAVQAGALTGTYYLFSY